MILKKPYKNIDEFYSATESLVASLRELGYNSDSEKINVILHGVWTTGSELLGELMLCLEGIKLKLPNETQKLKNDCQYFAKYYRKILGQD